MLAKTLASKGRGCTEGMNDEILHFLNFLVAFFSLSRRVLKTVSESPKRKGHRQNLLAAVKIRIKLEKKIKTFL